MDLFLRVLPFVALAACPLMMVVCMVGMGMLGRMHALFGRSKPEADRTADASNDTRVRALEKQLEIAQLKLANVRSDDAVIPQTTTTSDGR
jgi:hypothetical protein